mmetsp:Transcript_37197/g.119579  ORF Transcript_37197/g.119579 Transcript_37197/m.119579 type:complete len:389 (-) Transcript_37197:371-1537(-)
MCCAECSNSPEPVTRASFLPPSDSFVPALGSKTNSTTGTSSSTGASSRSSPSCAPTLGATIWCTRPSWSCLSLCGERTSGRSSRTWLRSMRSRLASLSTWMSSTGSCCAMRRTRRQVGRRVQLLGLPVWRRGRARQTARHRRGGAESLAATMTTPTSMNPTRMRRRPRLRLPWSRSMTGNLCRGPSPPPPRTRRSVRCTGSVPAWLHDSLRSWSFKEEAVQRRPPSGTIPARRRGVPRQGFQPAHLGRPSMARYRAWRSLLRLPQQRWRPALSAFPRRYPPPRLWGRRRMAVTGTQRRLYRRMMRRRARLMASGWYAMMQRPWRENGNASGLLRAGQPGEKATRRAGEWPSASAHVNVGSSRLRLQCDQSARQCGGGWRYSANSHRCS